MNTKLTLAVAGLSVALLALVPSGDADCCGITHDSTEDFGPKCCADCTKVKEWYCAKGSGGCNIFGCNCEGGCIEQGDFQGPCTDAYCKAHKRRSAREIGGFKSVPLKANYTGHDVVNYVDVNKDGRLDEVEVKIFVTRHGLPADAWRALDADGDGHLTAHEIDSDLVPTATLVV